MSASLNANISAPCGRGFVLPVNLFSAEKQPASLGTSMTYGQDQRWTGHKRHRSSF